MDKFFINRSEFDLRWIDMDAYQHLNNARYFDLMGEARARLFKTTASLTCQLIVVETQCYFKKSYYYPDTVVIDQYCNEIKPASFILSYEFKSLHDAGILYAKGYVKIVCYDSIKQKVIAIPEEVMSALTNA